MAAASTELDTAILSDLEEFGNSPEVDSYIWGTGFDVSQDLC